MICCTVGASYSRYFVGSSDGYKVQLLGEMMLMLRHPAKMQECITQGALQFAAVVVTRCDCDLANI